VRVLRTFLGPYKVWLTIVVALQLLATLSALYLPTLNADIIDKGVSKGDTGYILATGGWMLLISLLQILCAICAAYFSAKAAMSAGRDIRRALFNRVGTFSARELARFGAPSLITRNTNDVQQVQMLVVLSCTLMVAAPITVVGGIIMAVHQEARLSWLVAVSLPVLTLVIGLVVWRMVPQFRAMQAKLDGINRVLREQITGVRVVRAFVREPVEEARFDVANRSLADTSLRAGRWAALLFPVVMLVVNATLVALLWLSGHYIDSGTMQVGEITAFMSYLMQILMSVLMASFMVVMIPRAAVCAERIIEVLDTHTSVEPPLTPITELPTHAQVEFRGVSYAYPGAAASVLSEISLTARAGTVTGIIGSTGSGKTTLISLIPRLFDATEGAVLVDGINVRELEPELLWGRIGLVPQKAYLFSGTIASNLRYGNPEATDEDLWAALDVAQATEFVVTLPDGLQAPIAQGGTNVSGGQRQRLAIARALVRKPEIYLFDDSFSALDMGTDARLRAALKPATRDATVIVVAQRVSTIRDADQIIVLDRGDTRADGGVAGGGGAIVGVGTHDELRLTCPAYAEIVTSQLSAEEAA
jgi:ATP-binding cassette subfamily B protein